MSGRPPFWGPATLLPGPRRPPRAQTRGQDPGAPLRRRSSACNPSPKPWVLGWTVRRAVTRGTEPLIQIPCWPGYQAAGDVRVGAQTTPPPRAHTRLRARSAPRPAPVRFSIFARPLAPDSRHYGRRGSGLNVLRSALAWTHAVSTRPRGPRPAWQPLSDPTSAHRAKLTSRSSSGLGATARAWAVWHSRQPGMMGSEVSFSVYGKQFAPWPGPFKVTPGLCRRHVALGLEAERCPCRPRDLGTRGSETGTRPSQVGDEPVGTAQMHPSRPSQKGLP